MRYTKSPHRSSLRSLVLLVAFTWCAVTTPHSMAQDCFPQTEMADGFDWAENNLKYWDGGVRKQIKLADPSILKLEDSAGQTWFFITGTDSGQRFPYQGVLKGIGMTNFVIYRSTNLVDWYFHSFVFDRAMQGVNAWDADTMFIPAGNNPPRFFKRFGSPSLHYDPNNGDGTIYLSFSAAELFVPGIGLGVQGDNNLDGDSDPRPDYDLDGDGNSALVDPTPGDAAAQQQTAFVIWTEKSRFLQGKPWMSPSDTNGQPFRTWFPIMYSYRVNNTGVWNRDGGVAQALANGDTYASIPTSGSTNYSKRYIVGQVEVPGYAWHAPWGFHWAGVGPRAWPQVNTNVYYDSNDNCKPWLVWTWAQRSGYSWDTNNVAAFPLLGGPHSGQGFRLADALYQNPNFAPPNNTQPLQLFYAYDPDTLYFGNIPNGKLRANLTTNAPELHTVGVAEGGTLFTRTAQN